MTNISIYMPTKDGVIYIRDNDQVIAVILIGDNDTFDLYLWAMQNRYGYDMDGIRLKVIGVDIV